LCRIKIDKKVGRVEFDDIRKRQQYLESAKILIPVKKRREKNFVVANDLDK